MKQDSVDRLLQQWRAERPELDVSTLGIAIRVEMLAKLMRRETAEGLSLRGLKTWEYDVLSALRRQGEPYKLPMTELARASLLTSGAMTTRIDGLIEQGLVRRDPDPDDRRGVRVSLTKKGLAVVDQAIETRLKAAETAVGFLNRKERLATEAALRKMLLATE
jgi:DNA-binding MarR family transcriptional regulator